MRSAGRRGSLGGPTAPTMSSRLTPLRLPAFRRLLTAYFVGRAGDWFGQIALSVVVLQASGSVLAVSLLWILAVFAPGAVAPFALDFLRGRRTDRVLIVARATEGALFAALAVSASIGLPLEVFLALAVCDGILNVVASGLTKASIVCVTRPAGVHAEANALVNLAFTVSFAAGPALAGLVIAGVGAPVALGLDAASFLIAAIALIGVGAVGGVQADPGPGAPRLAGVRRLLARPRLRSLLIADGLSGVCFGLIIPVELVFVTGTLGGTAADYGIVLAAWGAGAVIGGGLLVRWASLDGASLVAASFVGMIVAYLGMATASSIAIVIAFSFVGGVGNGVEGGALMTLVQQHAPDHEQSDLGCLLESLHSCGPGLGYLLGGLIAAAASPRDTYVIAGIGGLAAVAMLAHAVWLGARALQPVPSPT